VHKHFPESDETQKGHMKQQRQNVRSTKVKQNATDNGGNDDEDHDDQFKPKQNTKTYTSRFTWPTTQYTSIKQGVSPQHQAEETNI